MYIELLKSKNWAIIQNVIFPLKKLLDEEIYAINPSLYISLHIQRHNTVTVNGLPINEDILEITQQTPSTNNIQRLFDYVIDAKYVEYCICDNSTVRYSFKVNFEKDTYTINTIGKKYQYGTTPQLKDWKQLKENFRKELCNFLIWHD